MDKLRHASTYIQLFIVMAFTACTFVLLAFRDGFDFAAIVYGLLTLLLAVLGYILLAWIAPCADRIVYLIAAFLFSLGLAVQYRFSPDSAAHQLLMTGLGLGLMCLMLLIMRRSAFLRLISIPMALGSLAILAALLFIGHESGGAVNWISIGGTLFQPSEFVKVALILILADAFTERVRLGDAVPAALFTVAVAGMLVMQRDLGAAVLISGVALIIYFVASGNAGVTALGLAIGGAGAVASYFVFDHVRSRVEIWLDPWATYSTSGYQIAQGLMAIASGGLLGSGLGMGSPKLVPAYHTDYIFAVICEEFGLLFGIAVIVLYLLLIVRSVRIALDSTGRYHMLAAFGAASLFAIQTFIIIGGVIKLIPLTGITMPFVSYGGSSMLACMLLLGLIEGVSEHNGEELEAALEEMEEEA